MKRFFSAVLFLAASFATPALAAPERLVNLLSMIDVQPTREQLFDAGAGQNGEVLEAIALDPTATRYVRTRAASSLSLFDSAAARSSLAKLIDLAGDPEVRIQAISAYGALEGRAAVSRFAGLLTDRHPEVRAAAVRALARTQAPAVASLLAARLAVDGEESALVRALIQRKLAEVAR
jgi:HEAT repeat protein